MQRKEFTIDCQLCTHLKDSLFNGLTPEDLSRINNHKTCIQYKKGQNIFYEGTRPTGLFCINGGKVKVFKNNVQGKEFILYIAKPGDFLGYRALLSEEFYGATATVLEDAKICFIQKENFFEVLQKNPVFMKKVVKQVCQQMGIMEERMAELAHKSVRERLAGSLLMLKESYGMEGDESVLLDIALSREDWASLVGTATETVIRLLSDFKSDELISFEGKKIRVLDPKRLAKQADLIVA
ncbi:MAG: Crp/Fnr family transcriptional regulator [Cyclobacteriaceae bacterium]|nr:Crp/Fnr family transcriptional regulator [Cyclobacteriaceae bacterium]